MTIISFTESDPDSLFPTVHLAVVGTKISAPPDFYYGRVLTGVEIYHTSFLTRINFNGRPGRITPGNTE